MNPVVRAWRVEILGETCICFSASRAGARYRAVRSYREAFGERRGFWPVAKAKRVKAYDKSPLLNLPSSRQAAWSEDHVKETM